MQALTVYLLITLTSSLALAGDWQMVPESLAVVPHPFVVELEKPSSATSAGTAQETALRKELASALAREDARSINDVVARITSYLGDKAGVPEVEDTYVPIPGQATRMTPEEAQGQLDRTFSTMKRLHWWKAGLDPTKLTHPLREPAAVIMGCVAISRAKLPRHEQGLVIAKEAGDFLIGVQKQAGTGVFPFPASRGVSQAAPFRAAENYLKQAELAGRLNEVVRNGWIIRDDGDGGLQFDNGECGVALLELYELTQEKKYLEAAKKAADWAKKRTLVVNWNYNSFSVYLLARLYRVTGEKPYLEAAVSKAMLGVVPGQLTTGRYAGRWQDPHNARPAYHYIMLRSLAEVVLLLPEKDTRRARLLSALKLGLQARNQEFLTRGAMNKDKAMEVLLQVHRGWSNDAAFLKETHTSEALDALLKLVSDQARQGQAPLGPREWGLVLEFVTQGK
jgi:hypothetical protein